MFIYLSPIFQFAKLTVALKHIHKINITKKKNNVFSNKKVSIYQLLYFLELISVYSEQQYMQIMLDSCIPLLAVSANAHTDFPPERRFLLPIPLRLSA